MVEAKAVHQRTEPSLTGRLTIGFGGGWEAVGLALILLGTAQTFAKHRSGDKSVLKQEMTALKSKYDGVKAKVVKGGLWAGLCVQQDSLARSLDVYAVYETIADGTVQPADEMSYVGPNDSVIGQANTLCSGPGRVDLAKGSPVDVVFHKFGVHKNSGDQYLILRVYAAKRTVSLTVSGTAYSVLMTPTAYIRFIVPATRPGPEALSAIEAAVKTWLQPAASESTEKPTPVSPKR